MREHFAEYSFEGMMGGTNLPVFRELSGTSSEKFNACLDLLRAYDQYHPFRIV